jgi:2-dehydro-3-deoxyphosphogluconate aldolase/(4S)-4-hydroxy-2-oxoglutarate aldolase
MALVIDDRRPPVPAVIREGQVIAILRGIEPSRLSILVRALAEGGIRAVEVTLNSPGALASIEALCADFSDRGLAIGAGTVLDRRSAMDAVSAGATFLVAPHVDAATIGWAVDHGIPMLPGAMTPTEILVAWSAGASAVKLFPASAVGSAFVREMHGPLPDVPLVPAGGITAATARAYIGAGALAVGVGSWLTAGGDVDATRNRSAELVAAVAGP